MEGGERFFEIWVYENLEFINLKFHRPSLIGRSPFAEISSITGTTHHHLAADPLLQPTSITSQTGSSKKRSFLNNLARRRTTEVRMLPTSSDSASYLADVDVDGYKRPRSPIDKIKSLFRSSGSAKSTGGGGGNKMDVYTPSSYSPNPIGGSSRFTSQGGASGYHPSTTSSLYPSTGTGAYSSSIHPMQSSPLHSHQQRRYGTGGRLIIHFMLPSHNYSHSL